VSQPQGSDSVRKECLYIHACFGDHSDCGDCGDHGDRGDQGDQGDWISHVLISYYPWSFNYPAFVWQGP